MPTPLEVEIMEEQRIVRQQLLADWLAAQTEVASFKPAIAKEMELRKAVMAEFFPLPKEGVNDFQLAEGWVLKGTYKLDRKVDLDAIPAVYAKLREMGVNPDPLLEYKASLVTSAYKAMATINPEAAHVFDQALIIKPASPTIELKAPK